jgi:hypothetical protein
MSNSTPTPTQSPLVLTIQPSKSVYHDGERIVVSLILTNTGEKSLFVYGRMDFATFATLPEMNIGSILVWDPKGNAINYKREINLDWQPRVEDFVYLAPGETLIRCEIIEIPTEYYDIGIYKLVAIYRNSFDSKDVFQNSTDTRVAWKGTITSEPATFELQP